MTKLNNHDLAQARQKEIYGGEKVYVLEKLNFINQIKNNNVLKYEDFKNILLNYPHTGKEKGFLKERNTGNLFSSHLILESTENKINVNPIENNIVIYLKKIHTQKMQRKVPSEEDVCKFNFYQKKTLIEYLSLQKARNINSKLHVLDDMINMNYIMSQSEIDEYQKYVNNYIIDSYFDNVKKYSTEICSFDRINITSQTLKDNLIFVSEYDVVNGQFFYNTLKKYNQNVEILLKYFDYIKDVELMVINQNVLYMFTNKKYLELNINDKKIIHNFIANNWNTFTILSCYKYAIISKEESAKCFVSDILYDLYKNNKLNYDNNNSYLKLECIYEKLKQK